MPLYKLTVREVVCRDFEIEATSRDEARSIFYSDDCPPPLGEDGIDSEIVSIETIPGLEGEPAEPEGPEPRAECAECRGECKGCSFSCYWCGSHSEPEQNTGKNSKLNPWQCRDCGGIGGREDFESNGAADCWLR